MKIDCEDQRFQQRRLVRVDGKFVYLDSPERYVLEPENLQEAHELALAQLDVFTLLDRRIGFGRLNLATELRSMLANPPPPSSNVIDPESYARTQKQYLMCLLEEVLAH